MLDSRLETNDVGQQSLNQSLCVFLLAHSVLGGGSTEPTHSAQRGPIAECAAQS